MNPLMSMIGNMGGGNNPMGATVLTLKLNGEAVGGTEMDYTVVTANTYQNVSADTLIPVPAGTSLTVSVGNISITEVLVKDANLIIKKVA